jgi:phosphocarrier protein HPr
MAVSGFTSSTAILRNNLMSKVVKRIEIKNKLGVHARAAALLVQTVNKFSSQVSLSKDGQTIDARSIMGVLTLAAAQGTKIQVEATGEDAERTVKAIERLVENRFNEDE